MERLAFLNPEVMSNFRGLLKYSPEERSHKDKFKREKKASKKIRRKDYLAKSIQKLNAEIKELNIDSGANNQLSQNNQMDYYDSREVQEY